MAKKKNKFRVVKLNRTGETPPAQPQPFGVKNGVDLEGGAVALTFSAEVSWVKFTPRLARKIAIQMLADAETVEDALIAKAEARRVTANLSTSSGDPVVP